MRKLLSFLIIAGIGAAIGWYAGTHGGLDAGPLDWQSLLRPTRSALQEPPVVRTSDTIRIATFNLQAFGPTKAAKPHVVDILAQVFRQFDIVAVQEIRSRDTSVLPQLVDAINAAGRRYDYAIGPRLGRTVSKEQFAFVFDTESVEIDRSQLYTIDDPDDLVHREPYVAWFRVRGLPPEQAFTFTLVNVHVDPDEVAAELEVLDDVFRAVRDDGRGEDDVILLGDFNADARTLQRFVQAQGLMCAVVGVPTNTRGTAQYDNILVHPLATSEYTGRAGIFDFLRQYNLTLQQALEVSDHVPVWAEFSVYEGGTAGLGATQ